MRIHGTHQALEMLPKCSPNNKNNTDQTVSYTDIKERIPTDQKYKKVVLLAYYFLSIFSFCFCL